MKKYLAISTAVAMFGATSAFAADAIIYNEPAPMVPVAVYDWSGGYVGLNFGYGGGKAKHPFNITSPGFIASGNGSLDMNSSGFLGGVQAGWNFQTDRFVYGLEADFQGANIKGATSFSYNTVFGTLGGEVGTKLNWYGTVRARLGYTMTDRFLAYATGGLAYGSTRSYFDGHIGGNNFGESVKKTKAGWTVGAGAEYAVTNNWSVKTEYLYTDLGKSNLHSFNDGIESLSIDRKMNFHTVRIGFNYKF